MKLIASLCLLAVMIFTGCSKSSDNPISPGTTSGSDDYFPLTTGSIWTYGGSQNYTGTATHDTAIGGKHYTIVTNNTSAGPALYRRDGNSYYSYDPSTAIEDLFLKVGDAGSGWTADVIAPGGTANHRAYTIQTTGGTYTVNGKQYTNVLHVHSATSIPNPLTGEPIVFAESDFYYAKGIGLIQTDLGSLGVYNLITYSIK